MVAEVAKTRKSAGTLVVLKISLTSLAKSADKSVSASSTIILPIDPVLTNKIISINDARVLFYF